MRNYWSRSADASSRPDTGDRDTGRSCDRMVDIGGGVGSVGMAHLKGLRTRRNPGVPASAAFAALVAQRAVSVVVLPSGNTEIEESRHVYMIPGTVVGPHVRVRVRVRVQTCVGDTNGVEQDRTHMSNRGQKSTPSIQALFVAGIESE